MLEVTEKRSSGESFGLTKPEIPDVPKGVETIKAPKRGFNRESLSDMQNSMQRVIIDKVAATDYSLRFAWRVGCYLFDNCCYACGLPFTEKDHVQADHVTPPVEGGSGNAGNLLPIHSSCNRNKGDTHPDIYFADKPETLKKIHDFQAMFDYKPDKTLYTDAKAIANEITERLVKKILHARNRRELVVEDLEADVLEPTPSNELTIVQNLMRGVLYYLETEVLAPSAKSKMMGYTRRILQAWYLNHDEDMFTQSEEVLSKFIFDFCLELTAHPDSFNRTHRAFRILAEVFNSTALTNIYEDEAPVTLTELKETHHYIDGVWSLRDENVSPSMNMTAICQGGE